MKIKVFESLVGGEAHEKPSKWYKTPPVYGVFVAFPRDVNTKMRAWEILKHP